MIQIVDGPLAAVHAHLRRQRGERDLWLAPPTDACVPWAALRLLLAGLRARMGDGSVDEAIAGNRVALSLILRGLEPTLTESERKRRSALAAQEAGMTSHTTPAQRPLQKAWVSTLSPLVGGLRLVFPNSAAIDPETVGVLIDLIRLPEGQRPELVFGRERGDDLEGVRPGSDGEVAGLLSVLEQSPQTRRVAVAGAAEELPPAEALAWDPLDDELEIGAAAALARVCAPLSAAEVARAVRAVRASFACFGFAAAVRLGVDLLARAGELLAPLEAARVHAVVALSAHNRQFRAAAGLDVARFIEAHLLEALEAETDLRRRAALHYRLAVTRGRRLGDLESAAVEADRAIEIAREAAMPPGEGPFLEAWALNIRAYLNARRGRPREAIADCLCADALLEGASGVEITESRAVIANNLAEVYTRVGQLEEAAMWQSTFEALERTLPEQARLAPWRWIQLLRATHDVGAAIERAREGLAESHKLLNHFVEDLYASELGELHYRRGEAEAALEAYRVCLRIRRHAGSERDRLSTELSAAMAAWRAGELELAAQGLERALQIPLASGASIRAEILSALALVAASGRRADKADSLVNEAIGLAVESGERACLTRVALAAAEACLLLGRQDDAAIAFDRALEIARTGDEQPAAPALLLQAIAGRASLERSNAEELAAALRLVPLALEDGESWWAIRPLLEGLSRVSGASELLRRPAEREGWAALVKAAAQRPDCRPLVGAPQAPQDARSVAL